MGIGDLIRYKHNGKMGLIIRIDHSRNTYDHPTKEADTHLVMWCQTRDDKQKWFVSLDWIERVEND